jgi:hypothetical protein
LKIVKGNVLDCQDKKIAIPHIVNDCGAFGSGFAYAVLKKYPDVAKAYKEWYKTTVFDGEGYILNSETDNPEQYTFKLGQIQAVEVKKDVFIVNMVAQSTPGGEKIRGEYVAPIRYESLTECMLRVGELCDAKELSIRTLWFGCGLAGGSQEKIGPMIKNIWHDIDVVVFEL